MITFEDKIEIELLGGFPNPAWDYKDIRITPQLVKDLAFVFESELKKEKRELIEKIQTLNPNYYEGRGENHTHDMFYRIEQKLNEIIERLNEINL